MARLNAKLRKTSNGVAHWCPACKEPHVYQTGPGRPVRWAFDGNLDKSSFTPSMKITTSWKRRPDDVCHYFLTAGVLQFCGDSTHELAGKSIDLPDWPTTGDWSQFEDANP